MGALRCWLVVGIAIAAVRAADESGAKPTVAALGWLAGTWGLERNGRTVTEQWMPPAGGTMLGMSRTIASGRTVEYELLLLRADAAGVCFTSQNRRGSPRRRSSWLN
jgi:hypothetical protein